jgi:hypothetical protein
MISAAAIHASERPNPVIISPKCKRPSTGSSIDYAICRRQRQRLKPAFSGITSAVMEIRRRVA